jgi:hypothetical protein
VHYAGAKTMNVYEVTFCYTVRYGNDQTAREVGSPMKVIAKDGDQAVEKAKKKVTYADPILEELKVIVRNVN